MVAAELTESTDTCRLTVSILNPSSRPLRPVVFAHAGVERSAWERPPRRLVGFARVDVEAGATTSVEIEVDWSMLDVRADGDWVTERGEYVIDVGLHAGDPDAVAVKVHR